MKLLVKYNRINIAATVIVLLISSICYYFFITAVLVHQLDKDLKEEEREITDFIKENNSLPEPSNYKDEQEAFFPAPGEKINRDFNSVKILNKDHPENISYRQLEFAVTVAGNQYKIQVRKSQEATDELIKLILAITFGIIFLLLITLFFINRFFLRNLWKPFRSTLHQVKQFNLSGKEKINFEQSNITEFTELNEAVSIMTQRVNHDYNEIKNFTENASHEIQTPLAIIKSKLELLSQSENLKEDQMNAIQSAYETTNRLSKLNQSLILLTKIDNKQFGENEEVNIGVLINKLLANYEELISAKFISIQKNIDNDVTLNINETLAEILITNLITNAIKHNIDKGSIKIDLTQHSLSVSNTGMALNSNASELFERFKKDKVSSESLDLGLSIVKKVCEKYGYEINYSYADDLHITIIRF